MPIMPAAFPLLRALLPALAGALLLALPGPALAQNAPPGRAAAGAVTPAAAAIAAIVNGEVVTRGDLDARARLFAVSTGVANVPEVLARLSGQMLSELIDERLKLHEMERRQVIVPDDEIAAAIQAIEQRNNMPHGALQSRLRAAGVPFSTMVDQIRVQIGWGRVVRQAMGASADVSPADIAQRKAALKAEVGRTEYLVGEIFVPVATPARADEARRFADTIIQQLRSGAPFQIVAAQFSQSQTALRGGDLGWVQGFELDPAVLRVVQEMPPGAISNPIPVPGGLSIVTLRGSRQIGKDTSTVLSVRQVFFRFASRLVAEQPTAEQRAVIERAHKLGADAHDCAAMEAAAKANGESSGGDPGPVRLEAVQLPALRQMMATLPIGKASQPLIADDGAAVMMVCSRETKTGELPDDKVLADRILAERFELTSRQMVRDLERRAVIERRL
jgi:peptidyl-prolyl cis-trans isomerase SurA